MRSCFTKRRFSRSWEPSSPITTARKGTWGMLPTTHRASAQAPAAPSKCHSDFPHRRAFEMPQQTLNSQQLHKLLLVNYLHFTGVSIFKERKTALSLENPSSEATACRATTSLPQKTRWHWLCEPGDSRQRMVCPECYVCLGTLQVHLHQAMSGSPSPDPHQPQWNY